MFSGYKTYILGGMTILGAAVSYLIGDATLAQAIQLAVTAALGMTVRHAVTTEVAK